MPILSISSVSLKAIALSITLGLALVACDNGETLHPSELPSDIEKENALYNEIVGFEVSQSPETATGYGISADIAGEGFEKRLDNRSQAQFDRYRVERLQYFDRLKALPGRSDNLQTILFVFNAYASTVQFGYGQAALGWASPYVINQMDGAYLSLPDFLEAQHTIENLKDAENYVERLDDVSTAILQELERLKSDMSLGLNPPGSMFQAMAELAAPFAGTPAEETVFYGALKHRLEALEGADEAVSRRLLMRAKRTINDRILPAYQAMAAFSFEAAETGNEHVGVWAQPDGEAYYEGALKLFTTTNLTPEEIHQMGLEIVNALTHELDATLVEVGLGEGSVGQRLIDISDDPEFLYPNTDEGRAALLADLNEDMAIIDAELGNYIGTLPEARVEVRRVPITSEAGAPGGYYQQPPLDGSRPGIFYINLRDTKEWPSFTLPTLVYHEAAPGHHTQSALQLEIDNMPTLRKMVWLSAYGEGWALYAEDLADEMGLYEDDPYGRIGYLQSLLFRAARLVVDTGLHHKKWTREEAIDYMVDITGQSRSAIVTEVERYIVWPGQACAYMVGREVIRRLRHRAENELGENFDIREFHDEILGAGPIPLTLLEKKISDWIELKKT